jgi:hypothetical protein
LLKEAGPSAEGFEAVFPYNPNRDDPTWIDFNRRYEERFHEKPEQFASLAYDAMNALLDSICKAGLNRARIHDALADVEQYDGVTGRMIFDPNQKNVSPMYMGTVHNGEITYRVATMEKSSLAAQTPYARIGEDKAGFAGPHAADLPVGPVRVVLFGPGAQEIVTSPEVVSQLRAEEAQGRKWILLPVDSQQNWGAASTQLVHDLMDEHALAIVALDRAASHLSEQLALKSFVPVIALSNDKSLTAANVPWVFRLPTGTSPAAALRLLEQAVQHAGANSERVRNLLASGDTVSGWSFLSTGELRTQ